MHPAPDRRRYVRYCDFGLDAGLTRFGATGIQESHRLLDLSWGGMCFESTAQLDLFSTHRFQVDLPHLAVKAASVHARIRHVEALAAGHFRIGAEFTSSDQGWLGPGES